jgi:hypothetical protein
LPGVFALNQLFKHGRAISELSRSEIAFALRAVPSHLAEYAHLALKVGRARACVDDASAVDSWELLSQRIQEWNLGNVCVEGCLVDGKTLQSLLGVQGNATATSIRLVLQASALRPCLLLSLSIHSPIQWQFDHPGCSRDAVLEAVTSNKARFTAQ